jgi:hypothetical protein
MKVTEVEYRETQSFGRFNNITVGMKATPDSKETEKEVYETLKRSVQQAIKERIAEEIHGEGQTILPSGTPLDSCVWCQEKSKLSESDYCSKGCEKEHRDDCPEEDQHG